MRSLAHAKPRTTFAKPCSAAKRARWTSRSVVCTFAATTATGAVAQRTHYQVLGVQPTASAEDIRTAFRRLAKSLHPDHNKLPGAREKFQEVKQAYDVLVDTSSRTDYDRELKIQAMAAAAAAAQAAAGGRRASTLSFRRSRAAGSSKAQAAARPASGDDFDAFTAGNTSPNGSSSPGSNSGVVGSSSYNSIFNETRRSVSRSRSASRSRSPGYRSVFDGLPRAATPSAAGASGASPSGDGRREGIFDRIDATPTRGMTRSSNSNSNSNSNSSSNSSAGGSNNSSIFNGRSISPNLGIRSQGPAGTTVPIKAASASSNPGLAAGPSPRAFDPTSISDRTQSASSSSNRSYVNSASSSSNMGTVTGVYTPSPHLRTPPAAAAAPAAGGMPATASPSPQPPRPSVTPQVSYARASGSSQQPPGTLTLQTCSTPAHTDDGSSAPLTSSAALQPPPPSPPKGIQAYGVISTAPPSPSGLPPSSPSVAAAAPVSSPSSSSSGPAPSSPLGSSIGDVASKLVALAAATAPAPRSGSGGSSSGGYISIFGGAANYTAVAVGGRAASPEKTSSSSTGTSSSNNIGRGSSGGSSTGGMLAEAAPAPSAAFQVTVSPKAVKDTAAKPTIEMSPQQQQQQAAHVVTPTPNASRSLATEGALNPWTPQTAAAAAVAAVAAASTSTLVADAAAAARVAAAMAAAAEAKAAAAAAEAMAAEAAAVAARAKAAALVAEARLSAMVEATGSPLPMSSSYEGADVAQLPSPSPIISDGSVLPAGVPTDPRVHGDEVAGTPRICGSLDCGVPQEVQDFVRKVGEFFTS